MKRKLLFKLSVFILVVCIFCVSNRVFAAEIFKDGETTYSIDEIKLKTDTLSENAIFFDMDTNNNYVFLDQETGIFYKVTETECTVMQAQEVLDFMNSSEIEKRYSYLYLNDYDVYKMQNKYYVEQNNVKTEDVTVDTSKMYHIPVYENDVITRWEPVSDPVDSELGNYYETRYFKYPTSATIDPNVTYYSIDYKTGIATKETNPNSENILNLRVDVNEEYTIHTKIATLDSNIFDEIMNNYYLMDAFHDENSNKIYFLMENKTDYKTIVYTSDGTLIENISELYYMDIYGSSIIAVDHKNGMYKLYNEDYECIFESNNSSFLDFIQYNNYIHNLVDFYSSETKFYNMYEYKLLSEDNQEYSGIDLSYKYSIGFTRLNNIKVNDTVLDSANYELVNGDTIKLKTNYLSTLAKGTYTLKVEYIDGAVVEAKFVIGNNIDNTPATGNYLDFTIIVCLAIIAISVVRIASIKQKIKEY